MKDITENERKVLEVLLEDSDIWGEKCLYLSWIEEEAKLDRKSVQAACKTLRAKGFAEYHRGLMDDDGKVAGSGYCLTRAGRALISPCDDCEEYAFYDWWDKDGKQVISSEIGAIHIRKCEEHYKKSKSNPEQSGS